MLAYLAWASLHWTLQADSPILLYAAFLVDNFGVVPYRDLFEFNAPGTYLLNVLAGRAFGYTDFGLQVASLACLAVLLTLTFLFLRRCGLECAGFGATLAGLLYLSGGPYLTFQRDFLALIPVVGALMLSEGPRTSWRRDVASGLLIGFAATIKPHSLLFLSLIMIRGRTGSDGVSRWTLARSTLACVSAGTVITLGAAAIVLWTMGALNAFLEIVRNYWPLYNEIGGDRPFTTLSGRPRLAAILEGALSSRNGFHFLLVSGAVGAYLGWWHPRTSYDRHVTGRLAGAVVIATIYAAVPGKFWHPHWFPCLYFLALLTAMAARPLRQYDANIVRALAIGGAAFGIAVITAAQTLQAGLARPTAVPRLVKELEQRVRPGEAVQVFDWTSGGAHALLNAKVRLATPFVYDFHFYHHASHPYIHGLRDRLLQTFREGNPRLVVVLKQGTRFRGPGSAFDFPALDETLRRDYASTVIDPAFVIMERRTPDEPD